MLKGLQGLVDLSKVDVQLAALEEERAGLPARRAALAEARGASQAAEEAARTALEAAEHEQRRHEAAAQDQEALLARLEGQQHQVKSNEAYTALLHEMDQARAAISEAETHILEAMDAIEEARAEAERAASGTRGAHARAAEQESALDAREKALEAQIADLRREREGIADGLDAALLDRYARIAGRRRPAVAVVERETCMGCRVGIPPQVALELRRGESLITCGHCQRILILEEHLAAPRA